MSTRSVRWSASNMVSGEEVAVMTAQGWTLEDGTVLGCGPTPGTFGRPPRTISDRVMARVRREIAEARAEQGVA